MKTLKIFFLLLFLAMPAAAQTIQFAWDAHPEAATITGFHLYQAKQSGNYTAAPVGDFVGGSLMTGTIPKPTSPGRYYWVLTAYMPDPAGGVIESGYSNEVTDTVKPKNPTGFVKSALSAIAYVPRKVAGAVKGVFVADKNLRIKEQ